jgi:hypothetical protein
MCIGYSQKPKEDIEPPGNIHNYRGLLAAIEVDGIKPRSSERAYSGFTLFKLLLRIFLNYISNAIPKVPHNLPPHFPSHLFPIFWPWSSSILGHIKIVCPKGLSFQ